ncbi:hypothetical protein ACVIGB_000494 [Bradyrhizobium sp. USDA 4341]
MTVRKLLVGFVLGYSLSPCLASEADLRLLRASVGCPTETYPDYMHRREVRVSERSQFLGDQESFAIKTNRSISENDGGPPYIVTVTSKLAFADIGRVNIDHQTKKVTVMCKSKRRPLLSTDREAEGSDDCVDQLTVDGSGSNHGHSNYLEFVTCGARSQDDIGMAIKALSPYARVFTARDP